MIHIYRGESVDSALRRFKRKVEEEGIIKEAKNRSFFLKPGERRRVKSLLAQRAIQKRMKRKFDIDPKSQPERRR